MATRVHGGKALEQQVIRLQKEGWHVANIASIAKVRRIDEVSYLIGEVVLDKVSAGDVDGELICVSNFASAVMDVPMESSGNNDDRLFIANEEAIPACGTPVTMILKPLVEKTSSSEPTSQP